MNASAIGMADTPCKHLDVRYACVNVCASERVDQPPRLRTADSGADPPCLRTLRRRRRCPLPRSSRAATGCRGPECVLATATGDLYTADWRGGVASLAADGSQTLIGGSLPGGRPLRPNGIALERDGAFLLADLGDTEGGVFRLRRDGTVTAVVIDVDGTRLPPTNFVLIDAQLRLWITVSTRRVPRALGYRRDVADGFVVLVDDRGARIVADGLGYTNEVALDPAGRLPVRQRDVRPPHLALCDRRRRGARAARDLRRVRRRNVSRRARVRRGGIPVGGLHREQPRASYRARRAVDDLDRGRRRRARRVGRGCVPRGNARAAAPRSRRGRAFAQHLEHCVRRRRSPDRVPRLPARRRAATPFARPRRESLPRIGTGRNPDDGDDSHVGRARRVARGRRLSARSARASSTTSGRPAIARSSRSWHSRSA